MKIKYDTNIDAKYISIKKGKIARTIKLKDGLFIDTNTKNQIIGIEILNASKNQISVWTNGKDVIGIHDSVLLRSDSLVQKEKDKAPMFKWDFIKNPLVHA
jgi:uncharacterized protein YuzE